MAVLLMLTQRARLHEGHAACGTSVLPQARVILVVELDDIKGAGEWQVAQLEYFQVQVQSWA